MNICRVCKREYIFSRKSGHAKTLCNSCITNKHKRAFKEKCVVYLGGKCLRCGYSKCYAAMDFHHRNQTDKKFAIGGGHCRNWDVVKSELDKCDLLCSNCHREEHARLVER